VHNNAIRQSVLLFIVSAPCENKTSADRDAHLCGYAQHTWKKLWSAEDVDNGFLNRAMLVSGNPLRRLSNPPLTDPEKVDRLLGQILECISPIRDLKRLEMTFEGAPAERLLGRVLPL
jgi:hypothetical protein